MRKTVCLLLAFLMVLSLTPALGEITGAQRLPNGKVKVSWDHSGAAYLVMIPKMSDSRAVDEYFYSYSSVKLDGAKSVELEYAAPGQDYWFFTADKNGDQNCEEYVYTAPEAEPFSEFKNPPKFSKFQPLSRNNGGTPKKLSAFSVEEIKNKPDGIEYGAAIQYTYPQLKKGRQYFGQIVITAPDGDSFVTYRFTENIPAGQTYAKSDFFPLDPYFTRIAKRQRHIGFSEGTYVFSLYWDGQLVDSVEFTVGP